MMSTAARALSSIGLVLLLTSATVGVAFFGPSSWLTLFPAGLGALLLGAGAVLGVRRLDRASVRLVVEIAAVALVVVGVNVLALQSSALVDVTATQKNTLAEASVHVAQSLAQPVVVEAALDPADRAYTDLDALIERYRRHTNQLSLVHVAPSNDEATVRLRAGDRVQKVRFVAGAPDQEQVITNALRAVTSTTRPRAYVLAGDGLPSVSGELRRFGQALADEGFEIVPLPLDMVDAIPSDAAVVVVPGAVAVPKLQSALNAGARMLVLLEPGDDALVQLVGSVGVQANSDVVIDTSAFAGVLGGPETATGVAYASHPATAKLGAALTHFSRARSLSENPIDGVTVTALVQTGTDATAGETKGPLTLAMAVERDQTRVVVVGDASFATNAGMGLGANADFAVNAALWLANKEDAIAIRARGRGGNLLLLSPTARERIAFMLLYGLPVLLLATGLTVRAVRRR